MSLGWIPGEKLSSKREKAFQVAAQEECEAATRDILPLKQEEKDVGRYLGGVSGGCWRRKCPLKEKNHLE